MTEADKQQQRPWQFSIAGLMVVVAVAAAIFFLMRYAPVVSAIVWPLVAMLIMCAALFGASVVLCALCFGIAAVMYEVLRLLRKFLTRSFGLNAQDEPEPRNSPEKGRTDA